MIDLDDAPMIAEELNISRSEARRLIATDKMEELFARREAREHRMPERAVPYDNKESR